MATALAALFSLTFFACASSPKPEQLYADRDGFSLMAPGAALYLSAQAGQARPILDNLVLGNVSGKDIGAFLDMTDTITAAVYGEGSPRRFLAAAQGKYPSTRGGIFFSTSKDWSKMKSEEGIPYWHSDKSRLSVYLAANRAYISDTDPFVSAPGAESPEALSGIAEGAVLSGWMNKPAPSLNAITAALGIPLRVPAETLVFGVYREDKNYRAVLRLETENAAQAQALVRVFAMARLAAAFVDFSSMGETGSLAAVFLANDPVLDGSALRLETGIMEGAELALLFNALSVYSK